MSRSAEVIVHLLLSIVVVISVAFVVVQVIAKFLNESEPKVRPPGRFLASDWLKNIEHRLDQ